MGNLGIPFVLLQTIYYSTCSVFLHEPSSILLKPSNGGPESEFGFTMGYQHGDHPKLVIGAPRNTYIGKVFNCPMKDSLQDVTEPTLTCDSVDIDLEKMTGAKRDFSPNQNYYFGGSIVGTKDYFLTCAPLITAEISKTKKNKIKDLFGTCIVYNDTAYQYNGTFEQFTQMRKHNNIKNSNFFVGGAGWSSLVDEVNGLLIIMKTGLIGDITFVPLQDPLHITTSVKMSSTKKDEITSFQSDYRNIGFGITSGKYFDGDTIYAYSLQASGMHGAVAFLRYNEKDVNMDPVIDESNKIAVITDNTVGSMFGTVLFSADLNLDNFSDILIGAPTHIDKPQKSETGAVHIFIGRPINETISLDNMQTILGTKDFARFGAALAASDIDGDGLPEIFIGAPYEDSEKGTLYVLSGMELCERLLKQHEIKKILITDFSKTQIIKSKEISKFGYSLLVVPDRDSNGCNELAVGAPGSGVVHLYRCIPTIEVSVTTKLNGDPIVKETANDFTIEVCIHVNFSKNPENINLDLEVRTNVGIGDKAKIQKPIYHIDLNKEKNLYCDNVTVTLIDNNPGLYTFQAQINISKEMTNNIYNKKEFNNTWVILSPRSKTKDTRKIERNCGDNCRPIWNVILEWSGKKDSYDLGSEKPASFIVTARNVGNSSYDSCLLIHVDGAKILNNTCEYMKSDNFIKCYMRSPLNKGDKQKINIDLNMKGRTNLDKQLYVDVQVYENCGQLQDYTEPVKNTSLTIQYNLFRDRVNVVGSYFSTKFTDHELQENDVKYTPCLFDDHTFEISNRGSVTWKNIVAVLKVDKKPFLGEVKTIIREGSENSAKTCIKEDMGSFYSFNCTMDLVAKSVKSVIVTMNITKKNILKYVVDKKFDTTSYLELHLQPTNIVKNASSTTIFNFRSELSLGNNINLIILMAVLVAFVILTIIILLLYKMKFFKRKEKKDLKVLQESVRRHSIKKSTSSSKHKDSVIDDLAIMDLVIEDDPFDEPVPIQKPSNLEPEETTDDGVVLIQETAQVHC